MWSYTELNTGFVVLQALLKVTMVLLWSAGEVIKGQYLKFFETTKHCALR